MHGTIGRTRQRLLLTTDAVGGVWHYSLAIAAGLAASGWESTLASMGPSPSPRQWDEARAIPGCRLADTGLPLDWTAKTETEIAGAAAEIGRLANREGAATIHLHTPSLAAFDLPVPVVAVAHSCVGTWWHAVHGTPPPPDFAWRMALMARGMARASAIIAPSHALAAALRNIYGGTATIRVVHNGLGPVCTPSQPRSGRVLTAGRLWDQGKNIAVLDRAAGLCAIPIDAAGPCAGPDGASIAFSHLNLLGPLSQPDLHRAMASAAAFAAPSLYEPFGLAVLEAAQRATPLVLADNPTFRELWDGAALFIDPHDPQAWATGLQDLLRNPNRRAHLGARAQARARSTTAASMVNATLAIHRPLVPKAA